jgi:hypothetical protein
MGYYVEMSIEGGLIKAENTLSAFVALEKLGQTAWQDKPINECQDLVEALDSSRYFATKKDNGDVLVEYFDGEKLGDDADIWQALAPHLDDTVVYCKGEDRSYWKWVIKNGSFSEVNGRIVYDDDPGG